MPSVEPAERETTTAPNTRPAADTRPRRVSWRRIALVAAVAAAVLLGWQVITTVGRGFPGDSPIYLLNTFYLDHHGALAPAYISYEYPAPPLYEAVTVALDRLIHWAPSRPLELASNPATRLIWLLLVVGSAVCLTATAGRWRRVGFAGLGLALLWGLDEMISLGKSEAWTSGQFVSFAAATGLVLLTGLIAREVWPEHPARAIAAAGFVAAYPVVLRFGATFHPETAMAFLSTLALYLTLRAQSRGWPLSLGIALGVVIGLDIDTRQSAASIAVSLLVFVVVLGRRHALRFVLATTAAFVLVGGPWLGYATYKWGNPLQSTLYRPGGMIEGGEPLSFYVSFPGALVTHPYRSDYHDYFSNQLFPKLHADLWSDWYGQFHLNGWHGSTRLDHATASSQSVLGFVADGLALGGLFAIGIPALVRSVPRRAHRTGDRPLALLTLVVVVGFVGFVTQIVRFPQITGVEIKASYLMFTAPCFAVFSVAAWLALARWRRSAGVVLSAAAVLYAFSYGTSLASTLSKSYWADPGKTVQAVYVDLQLAMQTNVTGQYVGSEVDYEFTITNVGTMSAGKVLLQIHLPPGMQPLGAPYYERGSGCTGTGTLECQLDFLPVGTSTPVRLGVRLTRPGPQTLTAVASSYELDATPKNNAATSTVVALAG
jgi:hypothetical protein